MKRYIVRYVLIILVMAVVSLFYHFAPDNSKSYNEFRLKSQNVDPDFLSTPDHWADSVLHSLSMKERIAQMIMAPAYTSKDRENIQEVKRLIRTYNIGGLIFFQGEPFRQAELTNYYQSMAKTPLFIAIDAEWGLGMRLDSTISYPRQMMLGAVRNENLIYEMGGQIAEQLKRIGVHINFAPVADVNNNPDNPVINSRSFGEDRANVTSKALLYMRGMQEKGIMAVAKHFPGHGDTDVDSHADLPVIRHSYNRLDSLELFPFKELINSGIGGIMTAHLQIPELDSLNKIPSSLSRLVVDSLLKQTIGFKGLVFTDAMTMKGITKYYTSEEAVEKAVLAGNDILVMPNDVPLAVETISNMIKDGKLREEEINSRCRKILLAKYWTGLHDYKPVDLQRVTGDLNKDEYQLLQRRLIESSLTVLSNKNNLLPFKRLDTLKMVSIAFGVTLDSAFQKSLNLYTTVKQHHIKSSFRFNMDSVLCMIQDHDMVIASLHSNDIRAATNYGIEDDLITLIDSLATIKNVVLNVFANPYILNRFKNLNQFRSIIVSYENSSIIQDLTAQMMFGALGTHAKLPVSVGNWYALLSGLDIQGINRLKYSIPLEAGMNREVLKQIDDTIAFAIACQAMPGCQVLIVRNGIVIMNKAYGSHEYNGTIKVKTTDIYDLASITKVGATTPVIMKLYDENVIDIKEKLSSYLPYLKKTDKKKITIEDIMLHQARLQAWIPFYYALLQPVFHWQQLFSDSLSNTNPFRIGSKQYMNRYTKYARNNIFSSGSSLHSLQVADNLFIGVNWCDSIYLAIAKSPLRGKKEYLYSDLGFYLFRFMIDSITGTSLDKNADMAFYRKLGADRLCFNPLNRYDVSEIVPTEEDQYFRKQIIQGYVHDPGAAMMGGVSGHAGLFSNANDLAKLFQMYLNEGTYAGERYINSETIELFTKGSTGVKDNRRGLGFDKPEPDTSKSGPSCRDASPLSYGHSGFTGTLVWNDPEYNLIYIFLSNRIFPDADNNKLVEMNIRTNVQQVVYDAIINKKEQNQENE